MFRSGHLPGRLLRRLRALFRDPLVHFLCFGALLFAGARMLDPGGASGGRYDIQVDRPTLLRFLQARAQSADDGAAGAYLKTLPTDGLSALVKDYVREEALYREAIALGLDRNDYAIRRRLVQSLEYAAQDVAASDRPLSEPELRRYHQRHKDRYLASPGLTFTHVFFSADQHGWVTARRLARQAQTLLAKEPHDRDALGDRFLYQRNYVDQGERLISGHFGAAMGRALFELKADPRSWQGPFESPHGVHLVQVLSRSEGGAPRFEEVRPVVERDAMADMARARRQEVLDRMTARYVVHVAHDLPRP